MRLRTIDTPGTTAHVEYGWSAEDGVHDIDITVDPAQGGLIESTLHECLHLVLTNDIHFRFNKLLEERIIRRLEEELWRKGMSAKDAQRWRTLINSKLEESE